jgi:hypothetical protein
MKALTKLNVHQTQLAASYAPAGVPIEAADQDYIVNSKIAIAVLFGGLGLGNNRSGGKIIHEILVRDGDPVEHAQVLIRLDDGDAETELKDQQILYSQGYARKAKLFEFARTVAKMKGDISRRMKIGSSRCVIKIVRRKTKLSATPLPRLGWRSDESPRSHLRGSGCSLRFCRSLNGSM